MPKLKKEQEKKYLIKRQGKQLADAQGELISPIKESEPTQKPESKKRDEIFESFARKIAKVKRLSDEEERLLGKLVKEKNDISAQKKLVLHNMRLALKMAHQYRREWTSLMDLVQEASAGMAIAAKKWDPDIGVRFGTYAAYWIRAQLTKFLMTNARLIHTGNTRSGRRVYFALPQIRRKLLLEGKEPTVERIADEMGEDPKEVGLILSRLRGKEASLSTPIDESGGTTLEDTIAHGGNNPEKIASHNEIQNLIKELILAFEKNIKNSRDLIIWRENLVAHDPVNLAELGKRFGVSKQRMGQLATRLKRNFRCFLVEHLGPHTQVSWLFGQD